MTTVDQHGAAQPSTVPEAWRDARGEASVVTRIPRDLAPIARALVTEEPDPHGAEPAGRALLASAVPER